MKETSTSMIYIVFFIFITALSRPAAAYTVVDTGQTACYDNSGEISCPGQDDAFYGQDGNYTLNAPSYTDNNDGTVTDNTTGLMWQKEQGGQVTYEAAVANAAVQNTGGYTDWRLPTIKELYSLILFSGQDPSGMTGDDTSDIRPFIDTGYFGFAYGDTAAGDRIIDVQYVSATTYVSTTMDGTATVFGVNFADGRIKGYPQTKNFYVKYVRGSTSYGANDFVDNGDGTVTDTATGLMWMQADAGPYTWESALAYAENAAGAGYDDWRLPNAKELESIVDYSRSPATTGSAAIDPLFTSTPITDEGGGLNYPFYWASTTHASHLPSDRSGSSAVYVAFGEALGWMQTGGGYALMDVHGAGAQRSGPKTGSASDYPYGHGPQGDVVRMENYIRLVRTADTDASGCTGIAYSSLQGFDREYYLAAKLSALQSSSTDWAGKTIEDLEAVLEGLGLTAQTHYSLYGYSDGLSPNALFNHGEYILAKAAALVAAGAYASVEAAEAAFVDAWPGDAYLHYLQYGAAEGLNPSSSLDETAYLSDKLAALRADTETAEEWTGKSIDDLRRHLSELGLTALTHYLYHGVCEGLTPSPVN